MNEENLLQPGEQAPDFSLPASTGGEVSLSQFRGRPTVLAFYPADFSSTCSDQMSQYQAAFPEFARYNAQVLGISVDGVHCHQAFADARGIKFPLLADFAPKGAVSRAYGAYDGEREVAERVLYVLGEEGTVTWRHMSPKHVNPGLDGVLAALEVQAAEHRRLMS